MRRFLGIAGALIVTGALLGVGAWILVVNPVMEPSNRSVLRLADASVLKKHVERLASMKPARDFRNVESLDRAADYLFDELGRYGLTAGRQVFTIEGREYQNIIATVHGALAEPGSERIILGAHYDVRGDQPGADDNASGVAGLLELARLLSANRGSLRSSFELAFYTLEEPVHLEAPLMGSHVHAKALREAGTAIRYMLSLEMIGFFRDEEGSQMFPLRLLESFYPTTGNFVALVGRPSEWSLVRSIKSAWKAKSDFPIHSINAPPVIKGLDSSDHASYWSFGYPALMLTDTSYYRNPHYHRKSDTPDTLDFDRMARVVDGVFLAVGP